MNKQDYVEGIKIVTIGGGSSYTPELIEGFIKRAKELPIRELWLVDIAEGKEKLEIVGALAKRMINAHNLSWRIILSLDIKEALKEADFVTTQFRVGQLDARILDERLPLQRGILGQETNGAGGIMKAFRTIPVILNIIQLMKEQCPDAWLINFTNPAGIITEAAIQYGGWAKTIGLCNVPFSLMVMNEEAMMKNSDYFPLSYQFAGINHFVYHRVWNHAGREITNELIDILYGEQSETTNLGVKNIKNISMLYEQIKATGLLPSYYHRYYNMSQEMLQSELDAFVQHNTRAEVVKETEASLFEKYRDISLEEKPAELNLRGGAHYSDVACECISALYNNKQSIMVVNTSNNGAISDLPAQSIVEISSVMTSHGPIPLRWGTFPSSVRGQVQQMKSMEECVIQAAVEGNYDMALQAFIMHPLIPSGSKAKELLNEMLIANKRYLPQFQEVITFLESAKENANNSK